MKKLYRCSYCNCDFNMEKECVCHEKECFKNPEVKACNTCKSHYESMAGNGKIWNVCIKGLVPVDCWKNNFMKDCSCWELED